MSSFMQAITSCKHCSASSTSPFSQDGHALADVLFGDYNRPAGLGDLYKP